MVPNLSQIQNSVFSAALNYLKNMFCKNCGTKIKMGRVFCPSCGGLTYSKDKNSSGDYDIEELKFFGMPIESIKGLKETLFPTKAIDIKEYFSMIEKADAQNYLKNIVILIM